MVYFRIEMGLGKDPKENKRSVTTAKRLNGISFAKAEAERIDKEQRHKTAYNYLTAVRSLTQFIGNDKWSFADITTAMLERYQRWLCNRGLRLNTVSVYMRTLRALYNRAVGNNADSPFSAVFTGHEQTAKRSVTDSEIRQLLALRLDNQSNLALARDLFVFSFMAMGMPFVDIAYLKKSNLKNGILTYRRKKTNQPLLVEWEQVHQEIVERYAHQTVGSPYMFPIIKQTDGTEYKQYKRVQEKVNRTLKKLGIMIGLKTPLTAYVARHSWASIARDMNIPIPVISEGMGHQSYKTTQVYLNSIDVSKISEANRTIIQRIRKGKK